MTKPYQPKILERTVKDWVRKACKQVRYPEQLYLYMPVGGARGASTLDFLGYYRGRGFAIETKAPGKSMTARQENVAAKIMQAGVPVFFIDSKDHITLLKVYFDWIDSTHESNHPERDWSNIGPTVRQSVGQCAGDQADCGEQPADAGDALHD